jgi:bacillithiol biosynthesis deacetylase BshB1
MKDKVTLDILAFAAHPDDIELAASGTVIKHISMGKKVGVVDLTKGELGTRGTVQERTTEAAVSSKIMGLTTRVNLGLRDCFFDENEQDLLKIVEQIRRFNPKIVLCNAINDRHPDHSRASRLVSRACFLAGLQKIQSNFNGTQQVAFRPDAVYHYIQDRWVDPDFIVDVTAHYDKKIQSILAFKSQFFNPDSVEPDTPISSEGFIDYIKAKDMVLGRFINAKYGEGFTVERFFGVEDITKLK